jgi:hypothetical protein
MRIRSHEKQRHRMLAVPVMFVVSFLMVSALSTAVESDIDDLTLGWWYTTVNNAKCTRGISCNGGNATVTCQWTQQEGVTGECVWCDGNTSEDFCAALMSSTCDAGGLKFGSVNCGMRSEATCVRDPASPTGAKCVETPNSGTGLACKIGTCT